MKMIIVIMTALLVQASAAGLAQNVTFIQKNASLEQVFNQITKQTGYDVLWPANKLNINKKIDADFKLASLEEVMTKALENLGMTYGIDEKTIVIKEKSPSLLDRTKAVISNMMRDLIVKGKVTDQDGKPLPNASIRVKGKSAVTNTNQNGEFEIKGVDEDAILLVSYVGFKTLEIGLKDAVMPLEIKLNVATGELEEIKVVYNTGYQELNKERSTGSFVQLSNEDINRNPSPRILDRILNITNSLKFEPLTQGEGTNSSNITIRGVSTINANMKPLIVIDGFPYEESNITNTSTLYNNLLNNINPNDIESVTILKDAAAASIWGARSGNGVIVITTKKGKYNQKSNVQFNSNVNVIDKPDLKKQNKMSSADMVEFEKKRFATGFYNQNDDVYPSSNYFPAVPAVIETLLALRQKKISSVEADEKLNTLSHHDIRDDINKYLLQSAIVHQYSTNISGGNDKVNYYTSIGYDQSRLSEIGNNAKRFTIRFENTYRPANEIEINTYINYANSAEKNNALGYQQLLDLSPYTQLADENGNPLHVSTFSGLRTAYIDTLSGRGLYDWHYRPLEEQRLNNNSSGYVTTRIGGALKYKLTSYLTYEAKGQYEKNVQTSNTIRPLESYAMRGSINSFMYYDSNKNPQYPFPIGGQLTSAYSDNKSWNIRNQLAIDKIWSEHQINGIFGVELSERKRGSSTSVKFGFDNNNYLFKDVDHLTSFALRPSGNGKIPNGERIDSYIDRFRSYFGNFGYTFKNRYTATVSGRVDASNFFGSNGNDRMTPLYSAGLSWNISEEPFYKIEWMKYLKIRGTYGYNGNLNTKATSLPTAGYLTGVPLTLHTEPVLRLNTPPNPGLTWEKIRTINLGIDFGLFENRLNGSVEYYTKKGINLIGSVQVDPSKGFSEYVGNYANMKANGFDININSTIINSAFNWSTTLNFSHNSDRISNYFLNDDLKNSIQYFTTYNSAVVGKPISKIFAYPFAGLNSQNGDPMGYVDGVTVDYNTFLTNAKSTDLIYIGPSSPQFFGNILNAFSYRRFSLSCNINYRFDYYLRRPSVQYSKLYTSWSAQHSDYNLRWQKPGDELNTIIPSLPSSGNFDRDSFFANSNVLVYKADHIRLNDIRLGVNLSNVLFNKFSKTLQLYIMASNLGVIWRANKEHIDPDFFRDTDIYPGKSYLLGVNFGL